MEMSKIPNGNLEIFFQMRIPIKFEEKRERERERRAPVRECERALLERERERAKRASGG